MSDDSLITSTRGRKAKASQAAGGGKRSFTIHFTEPEDLELYDRLAELAKADRRSLDQYVLLSLHKAFKSAPNEAVEGE